MDKSIAGFQRAMRPGTVWRFMSDYIPSPVYRFCTIAQSNSFALESIRADRPLGSSWCDWPKAKQCVWIMSDCGTKVKALRINHESGWLYYEPVLNGEVFNG